MNKAIKRYADTIKPFGLTLESGKKHHKVKDASGRTVATVSGTGETNALRQSIRDLARQGLVPNETRRIKF